MTQRQRTRPQFLSSTATAVRRFCSVPQVPLPFLTGPSASRAPHLYSSWCRAAAAAAAALLALQLFRHLSRPIKMIYWLFQLFWNLYKWRWRFRGERDTTERPFRWRAAAARDATTTRRALKLLRFVVQPKAQIKFEVHLRRLIDIDLFAKLFNSIKCGRWRKKHENL